MRKSGHWLKQTGLYQVLGDGVWSNAWTSTPEKNDYMLSEVARCNEAKTSMWYVGDLGGWVWCEKSSSCKRVRIFVQMRFRANRQILSTFSSTCMHLLYGILFQKMRGTWVSKLVMQTITMLDRLLSDEVFSDCGQTFCLIQLFLQTPDF